MYRKNKPVMRQTAVEYKKRVCDAMNFISRNIERELTLDEIADAAAFSKFHFHRIFKLLVGETIAGFTRRIRLEKAANRLIHNPEEDITNIAFSCGFSSSQNFARAFKLKFGSTPSEFRKSNHGNKASNDKNAFSFKPSYAPDMILNNNNYERTLLMKMEIKEMPEYYVAYVRKIGPYNKDTCEAAFFEITRWAGPRGLLEKGEVLGLYWDNPGVTDPDKCRVDACVSVSKNTKVNGEINLQTIEGGTYAVAGFEITTDEFKRIWDEAFTWVINNNYEVDDKPAYEYYHNDAEDHPEKKWIVDICIPIKTEI